LSFLPLSIDTYISSISPTQIFGSDSTIKVQGPTDRFLALLEFNGSKSSGISSCLTLTLAGSVSVDSSIRAYYLNDAVPESESSITYNNSGPFIQAQAVPFTTFDISNSLISGDQVTVDLTQSLSDSNDKLSIGLEMISGDSTIDFHSKEGSVSDAPTVDFGVCP
jgi:hypothetical protein